MLVRLIERAGDVVSKSELLDHVWRDTFVTEVSLTEAVSLLRQILDDDAQQPIYIQTLPRRGYRFVAKLEPAGGAPPVPIPAPAAGVVEARNSPDDEVWLPWVLTGVLLIALVAVSTGLLRQPGRRERPIVRFSIATGGVTPAAGSSPAIAVSRDGTQLVTVAGDAAGRTRLYLRDLGRDELRGLAGTDAARAPFFSPDGRWIGFFAEGRLKKVGVEGGPPVTLCAAAWAGGGTWTPQQVIVFGGGTSGGLSQVSANGGRVEPVTTPDAGLGELRHLWPEALPSGRAIVFTGWPADDSPEAARVAVVSLDGHDVQTLVTGAAFGRATSTGHLLFVRDGVILGAAFDEEALVVQGPAGPVLTTAIIDEAHGVGQFAFAASGVLAQLTIAGGAHEAWRWAPAPERVAMPFEGRAVRSFAYEPRRKLLAAAIGDGHRADVWVDQVEPANGAQGRIVRLTTSGHNARPVWTADGSAVVFASREDGPFHLFLQPAHAAAPALRLTSGERNQVPSSVSADGRVVFAQDDPASGLDIWTMELPNRGMLGPDAAPGAAGLAVPIVRAPGNQTAGVISSDGRWLAYLSDRAGAWRARLRDLTGPGVDLDLGTSNGQAAVWDHNAVLLVDEAGRLRECRVAATAPVCDTRAANVTALAGIRAGSDRALLVRTAGVGALPRLDVVLEWSKELSAKVPVRPKEVRPVR